MIFTDLVIDHGYMTGLKASLPINKLNANT